MISNVLSPSGFAFTIWKPSSDKATNSSSVCWWRHAHCCLNVYKSRVQKMTLCLLPSFVATIKHKRQTKDNCVSWPAPTPINTCTISNLVGLLSSEHPLHYLRWTVRSDYMMFWQFMNVKIIIINVFWCEWFHEKEFEDDGSLLVHHEQSSFMNTKACPSTGDMIEWVGTQ